MQQELGFLEVEASPATAAMEVMAYVSKLEALRGEIEDAEERLAELKEQEKHFSEEIIPQVLLQAGFEELKLTNGKKVSIKESLYCRLPEDAVKREEALEWLNKAGGGEKIKDEVTVDEVTPELLTELSEIGAAYTRRRTVHPASLQAWFNEALGYKKGSVARLNPEDVPKEFGLYLKKQTKIS